MLRGRLSQRFTWLRGVLAVPEVSAGGGRVMGRKQSIRQFVVSGLVAALVATSGVAGEVFRSVDDQGNVTYSAEPPEDAANVQPVPIEPSPTGEEIEAAARQGQRDWEMSEKMQQSRLERERLRAEQEKEQRQRVLDEAQLQRLQQYDDGYGDYGSGYVWPLYPYHGGHPHYGGPPHPGHRPIKPRPERPSRPTATVNVPGRAKK